MLARLAQAFRQAPEAPRLADARAVDGAYRVLRNEVLYGSMAVYALFYFCRKNLSVALPLLSEELHYTNTDLGVLGSTLYITYGVCKFGSGLVADRARPAVFITVGLVLSALTNICFGLSTSLVAFGLLWGLNGVFQSTGAPGSAKLLAGWFGAGERGTKTGIWNISHQGGGGLVLIIAGLFAQAWGWRAAMIGPALLALVGGALLARTLHDRPEAHGLPPIDEHRNEAHDFEDATGHLSFVQLLWRQVLGNPRVWLIALASGFTYIVRYGALDWSPKYLKEAHGFAISGAGVLSSLLELAGIPGALLCGWLTDRYFKARRMPIVLLSLLLLSGSVLALYYVPAGWDPLFLGLVGFFTYGPQMLLAGVAPVDFSSRRVAAAAVGFVGMMSYLGATVQSTVTGMLIDAYSWEAAFYFWAAAALAAALACLPLWRYTALAPPPLSLERAASAPRH